MYKTTGQSHQKTILWGGPGSAYSARIYSYLIKKGIPFQRIFPGHPRFQKEIVPLIGYFVMPVMELPDGRLIQDSTEALCYWEDLVSENPLVPTSHQQRAISWLLAFFGAEMMLRIGLHYRWSYLDKDRPFAEAMFANFHSNERTMEAKRKDIAPLMEYFGGHLGGFGITNETIPAIEASYIELLEVLNEHFLEWPYLLGGRPGPADFGMITLLYAHLSRDPYSSHLMKLHAPQVFRWTERMNEPGIVDGEFSDIAPAYLANDELPDTLIPVLKYFFRENEAEILSMVESFNAWCDTQPELESGTPLRTSPKRLSAHPVLGKYSFKNRGVMFEANTLASVIYTFQRARDEVFRLSKNERTTLDSTIQRAGGTKIVNVNVTRRVQLQNGQYFIE